MLNNETLKRLKLIEQLILLEEFDQIENQVKKLKKSIENQRLILELETHVKNKSYSSIIEIIQSSTKNKSNVVEFENPTLKALKIELKQLEFELNDKNNELAELEKIIHNFDLRQNKEFGNILEQILRLKKEKLEKEKNINPKKKKDFEEAKFEYEEFHQQFENSKKEDLIELTDKQKRELKKLYREASKLCHPDIVAEKLKIQAEEIFKKLSKAYEENNIKEVKKIYDTLINGQFNLKKSDTINKTELLKLEVAKLRALIDEINKKIDDLKHTESYELISQIDDLDKYFVKTKKDLLEELKYLQQNE